MVYGLATGIWQRASVLAVQLAGATLGLLMVRTAVRMGCSARIYGLRFACGVPLRAVYANLLNATATLAALRQFFWAKLRKRRIAWLKTEHAYPGRPALLGHRRRLGELLVASGCIDRATLSSLLEQKPDGLRLGEQLVQAGRIEPETLYSALSFQQGLPLARIAADTVPRDIARILPRSFLDRWRLLPFRVEAGALFLASPEVPSPGMARELQHYTRLEPRHHLMTPREFDRVSAALL
jgi:adsorption protein B